MELGIRYVSSSKRAGVHPTAIDLHKILVRDVKSQYAWYYDVSKCAPQQALRNLETAYKRFFKKQSKHPNRKKKGIKDSFYLSGSIRIRGNRIKVPIIGWIKTHEILPDVTPKKCVISRKADKWFIGFPIEHTNESTHKVGDVVGVDLGVTTLATLSDGTEFANPKAFRRYESRLCRQQRKLARQVRTSQNRKKTKEKIAKTHARIANIRADHLHKLTSYLAKNHSKVVIEDLNVKGMLKNRQLAAAIADVGFGEFRQQLAYKCEWYGSELVVVSRWFPSSKTCSCCGNVKETMLLRERTYDCGKCGLRLSRDHNAAINLKTAGSSSVAACGADVSSVARQTVGSEAGTKLQSCG
jgi:putative transposase